MKIAWSVRTGLLIGVAIILGTNAIVLGGVAFNRSGEPANSLELTEREVMIARRDWFDHDNSGIDLLLRWQVRPRPPEPDRPYLPAHTWDRELHWLSEAQQQQLGFTLPAKYASGERAWNPLARRAFVVIEFEGDAYREALERAEQRLEHAIALAAANAGQKEFEERVTSARQDLQALRESVSRLYVVDVGLDGRALRERYPDRSRYAVVPAFLDAYLRDPQGERRVVVNVRRLDVEMISVPYPFRQIVEPLLPGEMRYSFLYERRPPRFSARVHWGRRWEPWIAEMNALDPSPIQ